MNLKDDNQDNEFALENYLKSFQPRSPQINQNAIKQAANPAPQSHPLSPRKPAPNWQTIGVSWLCGAAAGAAIMFFSTLPSQQSSVPLSHNQPPADQPRPVEKSNDTSTTEQSRKTSAAPQTKAGDAAKNDSQQTTAVPDLIAFAQRAQRLRPGIYGEALNSSWAGEVAMSSIPAPTKAKPTSKYPNFMQEIQIREKQNTTRQSLQQELLISVSNS